MKAFEAIEWCIDAAEVKFAVMEQARTELEAVRALVEAVDNCCAQTYSCQYGSFEYAHMDTEEWKAVRAALARVKGGGV